MAEPGKSLRDLAERVFNGRVGKDEARALLREVGLVTRAEHEELELRVAQLEHRLRLLEGDPPPG